MNHLARACRGWSTVGAALVSRRISHEHLRGTSCHHYCAYSQQARTGASVVLGWGWGWARQVSGGHHIYHHAQPMGVMAGWAGSGPAVGRTPEAECQWWADRLGSRRAEWGSAGAPRLFYSSRGSVQRGDVLAMGCGEAVEKLSLEEEDSRTSIKEDCRVLAYRHVPPCGKGSTNPAGSGAHGAADRPYPPQSPAPGDASRGGFRGIWRMEEEDPGGGLVHCGPPTSPPPLPWHWVSTTLRRQRAAGAAAGAAALVVDRARTEPGREGESCRRQTGQERLRRG